MLRPRPLFYRPVSFLILILAIVAAAAENDTNSALLATA